MSADQEWREIRRDVNRGGRLTLLWVGCVIVFALIVSGGLWFLNVITSAPKGQGDAYATKNSAANWTAAQARFEDEYADIVATDRKITIAAAALKADPDDATAKDTYAGTVNYCLSIVGDYNADARKYLARDFRAADLPEQIDDSNPATDCKG